MKETEAEVALRRYAAGGATLQELRRHGYGNYLTILGELGRLGLSPPMAPLTGETADLRRRGRAIVAELVRSA